MYCLVVAAAGFILVLEMTFPIGLLWIFFLYRSHGACRVKRMVAIILPLRVDEVHVVVDVVLKNQATVQILSLFEGLAHQLYKTRFLSGGHPHPHMHSLFKNLEQVYIILPVCNHHKVLVLVILVLEEGNIEGVMHAMILIWKQYM